MEEAQSQQQNPKLIFSIPVDSEHKCTTFRPLSLSSPHMRAFHLAWLSLFCCFFSTFSVPPLLPLIRRDLRLSASDIGSASVAAFVGSIFSRLAMGPVCDLVGPRLASAVLSLLTAPAVLAVGFVETAGAFVFVRFLIGFSLANFVANQFWMSSMFSGSVIGLANGVAAGWACVGSGVTQLVMPLIFSMITSFQVPSFIAWRLAFIVPSLLQVITGVMVLVYGQDLPDGKYIRRKRLKKGNEAISVIVNGLKNYRGWILGLTYGFCFGVELTTDNIIAQYLYDKFHLNLQTAGAIGATFGLANIISRPSGGVLSDAMGQRFGMRGRLWSLWAVQIVAGLLCILLGRVESLWASVLVLSCFSFFVQAASGLTFGVVPFVSKRSLGVISGMCGSGGTIGAVVTQFLLFSGNNNYELSTQNGISIMGLMMIVATSSLFLIYFPKLGGMFCGPKEPDPIEDEYYSLIE